MLSAARRYWPLWLALVASAILIVAEFTHLYSIRVVTVTVRSATVGSHHGYALAIIGAASVVMAIGAVVGGSRPSAWALQHQAIAALVVAMAVDQPVVNDTGLYGRNFEQARAKAEIGFKLETAGAVLLLLSAVAILVVRPARREAGPRRARPADVVSPDAG